MDADRVQVHRPLDLAGIRAVGFDLDHTLALYDDDAANRIACEETSRLLAAAGYPAAALAPAYDPAAVSRGLLVDRRRGAVVKIDGDQRVARALVSGRRLDAGGIDALYGSAPVRPAEFHVVHSFFDLAGAFLFGHLAHEEAIPSADFGRLCDDVLVALDRAHTTGDFKRRILDDVDRLVAPPGGAAAGLARWREAGKRLFIVTNSGPTYTTALLDHLFAGPAWRALFALVVTDAAKPTFFARGDGTRGRTNATEVERALGVAPHEVLFVGDNAAADVIPAARRGWRTAHVVAERVATVDDASLWGSPLLERDRPTWFAALTDEHADLSAATVTTLLALPPDASQNPSPTAARD